MTRPISRLTAVVLIAASAAFVSACSSPAEPETAPTETSAPTPTSPQPTPTADEPAVPVGDPTCDTIIPAATVDVFESQGWTAQAGAFRAGSIELTGGVQCVWGDYTIATDHVQIFGWAPITDAQAAAAQDELTESGWTREEAGDNVYVTESEQTAIAKDEDGYGLTYLFGDGWVKYADTKQGLLLVEWPQP